MTHEYAVTADTTVVALPPSADRTITFVLRDDEYAPLTTAAAHNERTLSQQAHRYVQEALGLRPSEAVLPRASTGASNGQSRPRPKPKS